MQRRGSVLKSTNLIFLLTQTWREDELRKEEREQAPLTYDQTQKKEKREKHTTSTRNPGEKLSGAWKDREETSKRIFSGVPTALSL